MQKLLYPVPKYRKWLFKINSVSQSACEKFINPKKHAQFVREKKQITNPVASKPKGLQEVLAGFFIYIYHSMLLTLNIKFTISTSEPPQHI